MVRAILEGRKTQTRRIIKPQLVPYGDGFALPLPKSKGGGVSQSGGPVSAGMQGLQWHCPYGATGDRLWVRENWQVPPCWNDTAPSKITNKGFVFYPADEPYERESFLRPSIHMPRWASRITLEIISVRAERLQDISERDAFAEGLECRNASWMPEYRGSEELQWRVEFPCDAFGDLWSSINGPDSWNANPWVWAIEFKRVAA